jgi:hypothetical protein
MALASDDAGQYLTAAGMIDRHHWGMGSQLVLRSPSDGTGWEDSWAFSGRDESALRDRLGQLDEYLTQAPSERWAPDRASPVIEADDRWLAAMLLFADDVYSERFGVSAVIRAEAAWTAEGARRLAELLPEALGDLRAGIQQRFGVVGN